MPLIQCDVNVVSTECLFVDVLSEQMPNFCGREFLLQLKM